MTITQLDDNKVSLYFDRDTNMNNLLMKTRYKIAVISSYNSQDTFFYQVRFSQIKKSIKDLNSALNIKTK